nr:hypothetical protein BaRGS_030394 [Batillaria attramentaria]
MCAILPEFLRVVDPRQSGLLDVFYASEVINDSDNSSLSGKDVMTRKDQARGGIHGKGVGAITEDARKKKDVWFRMLEKFQNRPDPVLQQLQKVTEALLKRYFIDSPGNVSDLVRRGCDLSFQNPELQSFVHWQP